MNSSIHFNDCRHEAMDTLAHITPDKFQKYDDIIPSQDHQEQMNSGEYHSETKKDNYYVQQFLPKCGFVNAPNNEKNLTIKFVISINNPSPIFYPPPLAYQMQKV